MTWKCTLQKRGSTGPSRSRLYCRGVYIIIIIFVQENGIADYASNFVTIVVKIMMPKVVYYNLRNEFFFCCFFLSQILRSNAEEAIIVFSLLVYFFFFLAETTVFRLLELRSPKHCTPSTIRIFRPRLFTMLSFDCLCFSIFLNEM